MPYSSAIDPVNMVGFRCCGTVVNDRCLTGLAIARGMNKVKVKLPSG